MFKYLCIGAVGVFVCYHFYPREVRHVAKKTADVTISAVKAGYASVKK